MVQQNRAYPRNLRVVEPGIWGPGYAFKKPLSAAVGSLVDGFQAPMP
jgi:hypothetical protein